MKSLLALPAVAFFLAGTNAPAHAEAPADIPAGPPQVTLRTETPVVDVPAHRAGRQFLDLPALEYAFDVAARCAEGWVAESLSLNIADSRVVLGAERLSAAEPSTVVLKVPARQLAPVAVHGFCLQDDADTGIGQVVPAGVSPGLTIRAVLSAQASLLCRHEAEHHITYVSQPLDLELACQSRPTVADGD